MNRRAFLLGSVAFSSFMKCGLPVENLTTITVSNLRTGENITFDADAPTITASGGAILPFTFVGVPDE